MKSLEARFPRGVLGIIGGGQLGRMMCWEARRLGIRTAVLDPSPNPPAKALADICLQGSLSDPAALAELAARADVLTYEIEHIDTDALFKLEAAGSIIAPTPEVLANIQDKLRQKEILAGAGLPVPRFQAFEAGAHGNSGKPGGQKSASQERAGQDSAGQERVGSKGTGQAGAREIAAGAGGTAAHVVGGTKGVDRVVDGETSAQLEAFGLPCIQKTRRGGYDGRGVALIRNGEVHLLPGPSMLEELVDFSMELAVLLARSAGGEVKVYPVIEMVFDPASQICNSVCAPARIPPGTAALAREISIKAVETLGGVGIFAVELFLTRAGEVLINEIAPRPHNSGHWTIEGAATSQFEQHIRAVCGLPLGSAELIMPSVMVNLLGAPGAVGKPRILGYNELMSAERAYLHWYEKDEVRPSRKMGHFTVLDQSLETAIGRAAALDKMLTVAGDG